MSYRVTSSIIPKRCEQTQYYVINLWKGLVTLGPSCPPSYPQVAWVTHELQLRATRGHSGSSVTVPVPKNRHFMISTLIHVVFIKSRRAMSAWSGFNLSNCERKAVGISSILLHTLCNFFVLCDGAHTPSNKPKVAAWYQANAIIFFIYQLFIVDKTCTTLDIIFPRDSTVRYEQGAKLYDLRSSQTHGRYKNTYFTELFIITQAFLLTSVKSSITTSSLFTYSHNFTWQLNLLYLSSPCIKQSPTFSRHP